jgi:hypothetical protein
VTVEVHIRTMSELERERNRRREKGTVDLRPQGHKATMNLARQYLSHRLTAGPDVGSRARTNMDEAGAWIAGRKFRQIGGSG